MTVQNKVGHHDPSMGHNSNTQKSFLYMAVNIYNKLPRNLTLIKNTNLFKKWSKKYNINNKIILKNQEDYIININMNNDEEQKRRMEQCYNEEEN